jgi:hypothetical protein
MSVEGLMLDLGMDLDKDSYGMFSNAGNSMIGEFIAFARMFQLSDQAVIDSLWAISKTDGFGEASDTEVRERVLGALGRL